MNDQTNVQQNTEDTSITEEIFSPVFDDEIPKTETGFPVEIFPEAIRDIIKDTSTNIGFPVDFISVDILSACSTAIGNSRYVRFKRGLQSSPCLYLMKVASTGSFKSGPQKWAYAPLRERDEIAFKKFTAENRRYEADLKNDSIPTEEKTKKPKYPSTLKDDFTPEALTRSLAYNPRGLAIVSDEIKTLFNSFGRYNKGAEEQRFLTVWDNGPWNIDRKGDDPVSIPDAFVNIVGTVQPDAFKKLIKGFDQGNGMLERFLIVMPKGLKGHRISDTEISEDTTQGYQLIISRLFSLEMEQGSDGTQKPRQIPYTEEAKKLMFQYQHRSAESRDSTESEQLKGIYAKMEIYVHRFALIIQMMRWACEDNGALDSQVDIESAKRAVTLADYFTEQKIAVNDLILNVDPVSLLTEYQKEAYLALGEEFTTDQGNRILEPIYTKYHPKSAYDRKRFYEVINNKDLYTKLTQGSYKRN